MQSKKIFCLLGLLFLALCPPHGVYAQSQPVAEPPHPSREQGLTAREKQLLARIEELERRVTALEAKQALRQATGSPSNAASADSSQTALVTVAVAPAPAAMPEPNKPAGETKPSPQAFASGTTLNFILDGYYGYNFNQPGGRVNLLRAYDATSNSFSLNQAGIILERAPDVEGGIRWGGRLDLIFGQATEAQQGNPLNEPRPQVYRNVFQAYGTYIFPIGTGLTVDFGKWASSLGYENNYTKDQLNYSRSYFFDFLPVYHFGFRTKYAVNDKLTLMYHLINGANQSEDFNGFKSQHFAAILTPAKSVSWQMNYYFGREGRDLVPLLNPGIPSVPTQPGLSTTLIQPAPNGREHVLDTYASWNATSKFLMAVEGDFVIKRLFSFSTPSRVTGGAGYLKYQFFPAFDLAGRFEYLSDRGGNFSGRTQALKESTFTATYQFAEGFQVRGEFRRDFSNQPFFLGDTSGVLHRNQNTATLGLIWWFGGKTGAW